MGIPVCGSVIAADPCYGRVASDESNSGVQQPTRGSVPCSATMHGLFVNLNVPEQEDLNEQNAQLESGSNQQGTPIAFGSTRMIRTSNSGERLAA